MRTTEVESPKYQFIPKHKLYVGSKETICPFMIPPHRLDGVKEWSLESLINALQNNLDNRLQALCNGILMDIPFILTSPFLYKYSYVSTGRSISSTYLLLRKIRELTGSIPDGDTIERIDQLAERRVIGVDDVAYVISEGHRILDGLVSKYAPTTSLVSVTVPGVYDPGDYNRLAKRKQVVLQSLQEYINDRMGDYLVGAYLHGSIATLDFTEYSDLDIMLIPKREVILTPSRLKEFAYRSIILNTYFYQFYFLQHHGHAIKSECLLDYYGAFLPPEVFKYSRALYGVTSLDFNLREAFFDRLNRAWHYINILRGYIHRDFAQVRNLWQLSTLVSFVLIVPVQYLVVIGEYTYKKFSFEKARSYFSQPVWEAVDIATELRSRWHYVPSPRERFMALGLLDLMHNATLYQQAISRWAQPIPEDLQRCASDSRFFEKIALFTEGAAEKIYEIGRNVST